MVIFYGIYWHTTSFNIYNTIYGCGMLWVYRYIPSNFALRPTIASRYLDGISPLQARSLLEILEPWQWIAVVIVLKWPKQCHKPIMINEAHYTGNWHVKAINWIIYIILYYIYIILYHIISCHVMLCYIILYYIMYICTYTYTPLDWLTTFDCAYGLDPWYPHYIAM